MCGGGYGGSALGDGLWGWVGNSTHKAKHLDGGGGGGSVATHIPMPTYDSPTPYSNFLQQR